GRTGVDRGVFGVQGTPLARLGAPGPAHRRPAVVTPESPPHGDTALPEYTIGCIVAVCARCGRRRPWSSSQCSRCWDSVGAVGSNTAAPVRPVSGDSAVGSVPRGGSRVWALSRP